MDKELSVEEKAVVTKLEDFKNCCAVAASFYKGTKNGKEDAAYLGYQRLYTTYAQETIIEEGMIDFGETNFKSILNFGRGILYSMAAHAIELPKVDMERTEELFAGAKECFEKEGVEFSFDDIRGQSFNEEEIAQDQQ